MKKDHEILDLKEQMSQMGQKLESLFGKVQTFVEQKKNEETRLHEMYDVLAKDDPNWQEPYLKTLRHSPKEIREKVKRFEEQLDAMPAYD